MLVRPACPILKPLKMKFVFSLHLNADAVFDLFFKNLFLPHALLEQKVLQNLKRASEDEACVHESRGSRSGVPKSSQQVQLSVNDCSVCHQKPPPLHNRVQTLTYTWQYFNTDPTKVY